MCSQNGWKNNLAEAEKQKAETAREPFNMEGLLKRIAKFIVANDQVLFFEVIYTILF